MRPLRSYKRQTLGEAESCYEYEESIQCHMQGLLSAGNVSDKQACATCRYVISKGAQGIRPNMDSPFLKDVVDRCLVDCVLYALDIDNPHLAFISNNDTALREVQNVKTKLLTPFPNVPRSQFLQLREVFKLRSALIAHGDANSTNFCTRTIEYRLGPVSASKNVHLYSLSRNVRCYALDVAQSGTVQSVISISNTEEVAILPKQRRAMFAEVSKRFVNRKDQYCRGNWFLSEEIIAVPSRLWASVVLYMASNKRLASWRVIASAKKAVAQLFSVYSSPGEVPSTEFNEFAQRSLQNREDDLLPRADFLLCLRALKVLEQYFFSCSRLSVGPLKMAFQLQEFLSPLHHGPVSCTHWGWSLHMTVQIDSGSVS